MIRIVTPLLTFIGGLYFFLEFLLPETIPLPGDEDGFTFGLYHKELSLGVILISNMAVGLGVINLCMVHGKTILRNAKGSIVSLFLLCSFLITLVVLGTNWYRNEVRQSTWNSTLALINYTKSELANTELTESDLLDLKSKVKKNLEILQAKNEIPAGVKEDEYRTFLVELIKNHDNPPRQELFQEDSDELVMEEEITENKYLKSTIQNTINELSIFRVASLADAAQDNNETFLKKSEGIIIHGFFFPLGLSMFSLLAFYIAYAAYRSFRIKSIESAIMMLAAFVVILGQIPQGVLYLSSDLPGVRLWLMQYLSTPAMRAIYFSSAIAGLSIAVRMWLSIDKNPITKK
jgi:hypothetical protein